MQSRDRQEQATQAVAWLWVMAVHAGLFWLLVHQDRNPQAGDKGERMRLVFVNASRPVAVETTRWSPGPSPARPATPVTARPSVRLSPPPVGRVGGVPDPLGDADALLEQGRQWARQQPAGPTFQPDPLRNRRAQLPGGDRPGTFRMKEPASPARVLASIALAFGDRDPCPDIQSRVSGLLTSASDHDRELLQEELRRDREYCRP